MKKNLFTIFLILCTVFLYSENQESQRSPWTVYIGTGATILDSEPVMTIDGKIIYSISNFLNFGFEANVFHTLERSYKDSLDRKYQAEAATSGIFIQPHWQLANKWNLGLKVGTGSQFVQFRYSGKQRDDLVWTEEILDKLLIETFTLGLTAEYKLCPLHSLMLDIGYRSMPDTKSMFTSNESIGAEFYGTLQYGMRL
ncbi:hypothetical protein EXM22_01370 [Oceanispirochaeta crateris]|uniref:Outer membrane protein beta-barrel domain-containing protein n=1 Tax=Oceanispirochaeta crateris TaxID=2518645 RepID=A0A5C1QJE0_9SPIO|nr:hypothetical protein [Oceanispirochaeta crateris]QEN06704.1 hypothetical protein EXM22_01370 [Oceanispirochaeta crateris]